HFFRQLVRLEFGIRLEIENQYVLSAKALAARIYKLARAQENLNPRLIFFVALPFFLGFLFLGFFFGVALLLFLVSFLRLVVCRFLSAAQFCAAIPLHSPLGSRRRGSLRRCRRRLPLPSQ